MKNFNFKKINKYALVTFVILMIQMPSCLSISFFIVGGAMTNSNKFRDEKKNKKAYRIEKLNENIYMTRIYMTRKSSSIYIVNSNGKRLIDFPFNSIEKLEDGSYKARGDSIHLIITSKKILLNNRPFDSIEKLEDGSYAWKGAEVYTITSYGTLLRHIPYKKSNLSIEDQNRRRSKL